MGWGNTYNVKHVIANIIVIFVRLIGASNIYFSGLNY
jgi:hypothetical protein